MVLNLYCCYSDSLLSSFCAIRWNSRFGIGLYQKPWILLNASIMLSRDKPKGSQLKSGSSERCDRTVDGDHAYIPTLSQPSLEVS
eukprot:scaffold8114_cov126-Cylindrotheca_fusiformis.AAC.9